LQGKPVSGKIKVTDYVRFCQNAEEKTFLILAKEAADAQNGI